MSSTYSQFIWDKFKYLWYLQFPWRFLSFTGIFISLVSAAGIYYLGKIIEPKNKRIQMIFNLIIILLLVVTVVKYLIYSKPHGEKTYDERKLTSFEEISWRVSKTSFEFAPVGIKTKKTELGTTTIGLNKKDLIKESFKVLSADKETTIVKTVINEFSKKEFKIESKYPIEFRLNTFNFPGWQAFLNGKEIKINDNNDYKLITVLVPEGKHNLLFVFKNTLIRTISNSISLFVFAMILLFFLIKIPKKFI